MAADVSDLVSFDEFITHWAGDRPVETSDIVLIEQKQK